MKNTVRAAAALILAATVLACSYPTYEATAYEVTYVNLPDSGAGAETDAEAGDNDAMTTQRSGVFDAAVTGRDGWSQSGQLITQNPNSGVSLQANFENSKQGAGVYTVQFGIELPGPTVTVLPRATVQWTVEGNFVTRVIDVGPGTSISGVGQACKVVLTDVATGGGPSAGTIYKGSIQISPGVRANIQQPVTLFAITKPVLATNTSVTVNVPQNAGVVSTLVTYDGGIALGTAGAENVLLVQENTATGLGKNYLASLDNPQFVPLSPSAVSVTLTNLSGGNLSVQLTWGIDG